MILCPASGFDSLEERSESPATDSFVEAAKFFSSSPFSTPNAAVQVGVVKKADAATMTEASPNETPSTPAPVLRKRVSSLRKLYEEKESECVELKEELIELTDFTRLEQQIGVHSIKNSSVWNIS